MILILCLHAAISVSQTKSLPLPASGTVVIQPSAPAEVRIDPGAFVVNQPKPEPPSLPFEVLKFLLPSLIALGASYFAATKSASMVMKGLEKQLENSKSIEDMRQTFEREKTTMSETFAKNLQDERHKAENDAKKLFLQANERQARAEALNLLLGRIHTYGKLGQEWHKAFSVYYPLVEKSQQYKPETINEAENKYKSAKTATLSFGAEVIAAAEAYGRVPAQVYEHQVPLSSPVSAWTSEFENLCANHRVETDQIITDSNLMASDIRKLRDYELEIKQATLSQQEIPLFKTVEGEIVTRDLAVIPRLW